jgi:uncharacterized protein (DUF2236 family)
MSEMFASEILSVNARTLDLARATVIDPNVALVPRLCARLVRFVTVGLLSENLRTAYGLTWNRKQQSAMDRLSWFSRKLVPILPNWIRYKGGSQTNSFVKWAIQKGMPRTAESKSAPL